MAAAIAAARADAGAKIWILEQKNKAGKKLLATGNGRCNFTNRRMDASFYYGEEIGFAGKVLDKFGYEDTIRFFESLGLVTKFRGDYAYPRPDQASAVLELLSLELRRLGVQVRCGVKVRAVSQEKNGFRIEADSREASGGREHFRADRVILACGGKASPSLGSDGSGYELARALGHRLTPVVPALVQLKVRNHPFAKAQGVRAEAKVTALIDGLPVAEDTGELQITAYGISGIPVFQISRHIALGLYRGARAEVLLDLLPEYGESELAELHARLTGGRGELTVGECLTGLWNQKLIPRLLEQAGLRMHAKVSGPEGRRLGVMLGQCKRILLLIQDTNGFENAQVCAGGVRTREICPQTMESRCAKGLYLAGELLDIDGICGGYNLQWAWATGCIAGKAAAGHGMEPMKDGKGGKNDTDQPDKAGYSPYGSRLKGEGLQAPAHQR